MTRTTTNEPSTLTCRACGITLPTSANRCDNCGLNLGVGAAPPRPQVVRPSPSISTSRRREVVAPSAPAWPQEPLRSTPREPLPGDTVTLRGTVDRMQTKTKSSNGSSGEKWTFILELAEPYDGATSIQVEAESAQLLGSIGNGDPVQVSGKLQGGVLHAEQIYSEKHRAFVGPAKRGLLDRMGVVIVLAVVALMASLGAALFHHFAQEQQAEFERRREDNDAEFKRRVAESNAEFERKAGDRRAAAEADFKRRVAADEAAMKRRTQPRKKESP